MTLKQLSGILVLACIVLTQDAIACRILKSRRHSCHHGLFRCQRECTPKSCQPTVKTEYYYVVFTKQNGVVLFDSHFDNPIDAQLRVSKLDPGKTGKAFSWRYETKRNS